MPFTVLVSCAGRRVHLLQTLRAALERAGVDGRVIAADASRASSAFHAADAGFVVPRASQDSFVPEMVALCEREGVGLVVPTIDPELPVLAASRPAFEAVGACVAISSPETVAIGGDKVRTHEWLVAEGFPTVRQAPVGEVLERPEDWELPLVVKPRRGSASVGVAIVGDLDELRMSARRTDDLLVQSPAPGAEHTVDVFVDGDGRCRAAVPRRRIEVRAGEVSKGVTVRHAGLEALCTEVAERLPGAFGPLTLQVFVDDDDGMAVIELNPRFGGGYPLAWRAGADFSLWLVEDVLGRPASDLGPWQEGLVMLRYDDAVFVSADEAGL